MPRRSSRLKGKKKTDYSFDGMWNNMIKRAGTTWNNVVDILEDRAALPKAKAKPKPKPKEKNFQPIKKFRPRLKPKPKPKGPGREIVRQKAGPLPKIEQDEKDVDFDPEDRVARIVAKKKAAKPTEPGRKVSRVRRQLLFMLPGDEKILLALFAVKNGTALPGWARRYKRYLRVEGGRLQWVEDDKGGVLKLPFGTKEELRTHVKKLYFDPREPATIEAITAKLRWEWANLTKRVVTRVLRSLETYQLNFGRRRPPDIKNRMFLYNPGMMAMDMFFPSKKDGWEKTNCLCCMDSWSRYVGLYAIHTKRKADVVVCMQDFLAKFAALGHMPRRILSDKI